MQRSEKRILTTHAGSLPRSKELGEMFGRLSHHEPVDHAAMERVIEESTRRIVRMQADCGIDVGNNGEQSRESFFTYVQHRMSGFGGRGERPHLADIWSYPSFLELSQRMRGTVKVDLLHPPKAVAEVRYVDRAPIDRECTDFLRIVDETRPGFTESFMTAPSPGIIAAAMLNDHYASLEDYVSAIADALKVEYETIVSRGMVLQIDAPDLGLEHHTSYAQRPLKEFLGFVDLIVAAINRSLENVPPERVRLHVCWGNYEGPHNRDVALDEILPILLKARVGAMLLSMANPRHEHEYRCFERHRIPPEMIIIAGVVDSTTNYIEHPEVVADRIERVARAIGDPHRVMASPDCGFETTTGMQMVAEEIVWEKLRAMRDGAAIASRRLFG
ncbi:MAG TPA: cobalamin-independent methionine synthase II family protein [Candidatus Binataceae bacterium]|nr:cobalamin-independent methionine synthase II family protein [Candidatus Binataceae bacterium]